MKKSVWLVLIVMLAVLLTACGGEENVNANTDNGSAAQSDPTGTAGTGNEEPSDPTGTQAPTGTRKPEGTTNETVGTEDTTAPSEEIEDPTEPGSTGTGTGTGTGNNQPEEEPNEPTVGVDTETEPTIPGESQPDNVIDFDDLLDAAGRG